jgi:peptide/nickel transport system permease protein
MVRFLMRRLAATLLLVLMVSLLVFGLLERAPDPAEARAGVEATSEQVEQVRAELGLDRPAHTRYIDWLSHAVRGDLGTSLQYKTPVSEIVWPRLVITLTIAAAALAVSLVVGLAAGIGAALKPESRLDRTTLSMSALAWSAPPFWVAMVLVAIFSIRFSWFPATGWTSFSDSPLQWLRGLVLPALALSLGGAANIARVTRASVLEVLHSDHLRSVRVKGLSPSRILFSHVLPNAMSPVITSATLLFIGLFNAAAIAEIVFAIPGLGTQAFQAASFGDTTTVLGVAVVAALFVGLINLVADLLQATVNPRRRLA